MVLPMLSTRLFARNVYSLAHIANQRSPALTLAFASRSFSISLVTLDPAAKKLAKEAKTEDVDAKPKRKVSAGKKKASAKPKAALKKAKKVKEEKPKRMVIRPEDKPPKRAVSPYIQFYTQYLTEQRKNVPDGEKAPIPELVKSGAIIWNAMSEEEKKPYELEFAKQQAEYKLKIKDYVSTANPAIIREMNLRRKQKGKRKIVLQVAKQPMSAFMRFLADLRTETGYVSKTMKEQAAFTAEGGAKWRALSESERQRYKDEAAKEFKEWKEEQKAADELARESSPS